MIKFMKHHAYTALVSLDELFMTAGLNSSAKRSNDFVINSKSKVCLLLHTIQLSTVLQKLPIRPLANISRSSSQKSTWLGQETRWMSMGLLHNGENPNKNYIILFGVWMWNCTFIRDSNSTSTYCSGHRDDK